MTTNPTKLLTVTLLILLTLTVTRGDDKHLLHDYHSAYDINCCNLTDQNSLSFPSFQFSQENNPEIITTTGHDGIA